MRASHGCGCPILGSTPRKPPLILQQVPDILDPCHSWGLIILLSLWICILPSSLFNKMLKKKKKLTRVHGVLSLATTPIWIACFPWCTIPDPGCSHIAYWNKPNKHKEVRTYFWCKEPWEIPSVIAPSPSSPGTWVTKPIPSGSFCWTCHRLSWVKVRASSENHSKWWDGSVAFEKGQIFEKFDKDGGCQKMSPHAPRELLLGDQSLFCESKESCVTWGGSPDLSEL